MSGSVDFELQYNSSVTGVLDTDMGNFATFGRHNLTENPLFRPTLQLFKIRAGLY